MPAILRSAGATSSTPCPAKNDSDEAGTPTRTRSDRHLVDDAIYYGPNDKRLSFTNRVSGKSVNGGEIGKGGLLEIPVKELRKEEGCADYVERLTEAPFADVLGRTEFNWVLQFFHTIKAILYNPDLHNASDSSEIREAKLEGIINSLFACNSALALCNMTAKTSDSPGKSIANGWVFKTDDWAHLGPIVMACFLVAAADENEDLTELHDLLKSDTAMQFLQQHAPTYGKGQRWSHNLKSSNRRSKKEVKPSQTSVAWKRAQKIWRQRPKREPSPGSEQSTKNSDDDEVSDRHNSSSSGVKRERSSDVEGEDGHHSKKPRHPRHPRHAGDHDRPCAQQRTTHQPAYNEPVGSIESAQSETEQPIAPRSPLFRRTSDGRTLVWHVFMQDMLR